MRFKATLELPSLDKQAFLRDFDAHLEEAVKEGARVWLRAVTAIIPVWSGESQETLRPLATAVGFPHLIVPSRLSFRHTDRSRNVGELFKDGSTYGFEYSTDLAHLIYNEFHNANVDPDPTLFSRLITPGPYQFQERAALVWQSYVSGVRLPDPTRYIRKRTVTVG